MTGSGRKNGGPPLCRAMTGVAVIGIVTMMAFVAAEELLDATRPYPMELLERFGESVRVETEDGVWLRVYATAAGERRIRVSLDAISPHVANALILAEDERFFQHAGVDALAVTRAALAAARKGRVVSGASTLTMQLARILEPRPRVLRFKIREAIRARQIERVLSKQEILEAYLNLVPWGGTLRGIEAASRFWFGKSASDLASEEAAMLVAMLPAPSRRAPDRATQRLRSIRNRILQRMARAGILTQDELRRIRKEPIRARRHSWPLRAPHASDEASRSRREVRVRTSIDLGIQECAEAAVRRHASAGVDGVALVVVDRRTAELEAMVGSRDYLRHPLNAATCRRSAGSTLKPFLYALAVDECVTGMDGLLLDTEADFGGFRPRNFDDRFEGRIRTADALSESRNLPAVRLLGAVGADRFRDLLERAGIRVPRVLIDLDAALGTIAVSPLELARAYAWLSGPPDGSGPGAQARGAQAREQVLEALRRLPPASGMPPGRVAWKTGTSSGRRDAWSVGVTEQHVVVAWLGNLDGRGAPDLVGNRAASRLMAEVALAIDRISR